MPTPVQHHLAVSQDLLSHLFEELNQQHFDGFLDSPVLCWNSRLRTSAGRFFAGSRKYFLERPPRIEVASYLLGEPNGFELVKDTLAHEMIHFWLWVRRRPYGHTGEFWEKMKLMGVSRYNPAPKFRPFRYLYFCMNCRLEFPARRKLGTRACAACCRKFSNGRFNHRFKLVESQVFRIENLDSVSCPERVNGQDDHESQVFRTEN